MKYAALILISLVSLCSCKTREKQKEEEPKAVQTENEQAEQNPGWEWIKPSIVKIDSYDNERILETGQGFFVAEDLIVTRFSLIGQANKVLVTPFDTKEKFVADQYVAVDRINDLVILKVNGVQRRPIGLFQGAVSQFGQINVHFRKL